LLLGGLSAPELTAPRLPRRHDLATCPNSRVSATQVWFGGHGRVCFRRSLDVGDGDAESVRGGQEASVTCGQHHVLVGDLLDRGQMHGVVASESELLGPDACPADEGFGHFDQLQLIVDRLECVDGTAEILPVESLHALSHGEGGSTFGIGQPRRDNSLGVVPQSGRQQTARLLDHEGE